MRIKGAVFIGALLWGLLLFESLIIKNFVEIRIPNISNYIHYVIIILLILLTGLIYFRKKEAGPLNGLYLGFIFIFVSIILDSVITIPLFEYLQYLLLISIEKLIFYAITLVVCTIVGFLKE